MAEERASSWKSLVRPGGLELPLDRDTEPGVSFNSYLIVVNQAFLIDILKETIGDELLVVPGGGGGGGGGGWWWWVVVVVGGGWWWVVVVVVVVVGGGGGGWVVVGGGGCGLGTQCALRVLRIWKFLKWFYFHLLRW